MNKLLIASCVILLASCNTKKKDAPTAPAQKEFTMIEVPLAISEPEQRADYLAKHYWDKFNFADTSYISQVEIMEQAMANYINILGYASPQIVDNSIKGSVIKAEADTAMLRYFCELYDKYLYDPNSPMRNEEYYISVLEAMIASNKIDEVEKIRPQHQLDMALKNRVGNLATDFSITLPNGTTTGLYKQKAEYTLLYFYNPDCNACKEIRKEIMTSELITSFQKSKRVKILAVYPDEDLTAWKKHLPEIPVEWTNGYDKQLTLKEKELYDLKAIPTMYLLDKDKKVLLKDATFPVIEKYLFEQINEQ